jgi:hypothetical protein
MDKECVRPSVQSASNHAAIDRRRCGFTETDDQPKAWSVSERAVPSLAPDRYRPVPLGLPRRGADLATREGPFEASR